MTRTWRRRLIGLVVLWLAVVAVAWWLRTDPAVTVIAGYLTAACALSWLVQDLTGEAQAAHWQGWYAQQPRSRGGDPRLGRLHRMVRETLDKSERAHRRIRPPVGMQHLLAELAADRLEAHHGIPLLDPQADELLGPDLRDYLSRPPDRLGELSPAQLSDHLTRIEAL